MRCLAAAESGGLPRVVSIQNPYSLLNRSFEHGLAEIAHREDLGLLAYSPLGAACCRGNIWTASARPASRLVAFGGIQRYSGPRAEAATAAYVECAREAGLDPAQMALAYVTSRPFVTSNIVGATTVAQLDSNLASADLSLPRRCRGAPRRDPRQLYLPLPLTPRGAAGRSRKPAQAIHDGDQIAPDVGLRRRMSRVLADDGFGVGPRRRQVGRRRYRAHHVVAAPAR